MAVPGYREYLLERTRSNYRKRCQCPKYREKLRRANREASRRLRATNTAYRIRQNRATRASTRKMKERDPVAFRLKARASCRAAQARLRGLTPELSDELRPAEQARLLAVYMVAQFLTEQTGRRHEVDHIMPLSLGGPHVSWNLRPVTRQENLAKNSRRPTDGELDMVSRLHASYTANI
jgi:5-methylcytosine-specific restriction endonuclease McrA